MDKLNYLLRNWYKGNVKLSSFLYKNGYSKELIARYVKSNWLDSLGYGAYKLSGDDINWIGAIEALQTQNNSLIHPGGKSALELFGFTQYVKLKQSNIQLFGNYEDKLPNWFKKQNWAKTISLSQTKVFNYKFEEYFSKFESNSIILKTSTPELAIFEMLYLVPKRQSFEEAYEIMEGLTTLRPKIVQKLLEECKSVKVRRLFLFMSEYSNHDWVKELNVEKIDQGSGKRVIVKNGVLDKKYKITVPKRYER